MGTGITLYAIVFETFTSEAEEAREEFLQLEYQGKKQRLGPKELKERELNRAIAFMAKRKIPLFDFRFYLTEVTKR